MSKRLGHSSFTLTLDTHGDWIPEFVGALRILYWSQLPRLSLLRRRFLRSAVSRVSADVAGLTVGFTPVYPPPPSPAGPQARAKRNNVIGLIAQIVSIVGFVFACVPGALIVGRVLLLMIAAENQFNDPPKAGMQYWIVPIAATYKGDDTGNSAFNISVKFVGSDNRTYDDRCGVIPAPWTTSASCTKAAWPKATCAWPFRPVPKDSGLYLPGSVVSPPSSSKSSLPEGQPAHGIPQVKFWVDPHGGIALTTGEAETTTLVAGMPTPPVSCTAVAPAPPTVLVEDA